jgi:hypothetical protein
MDTWEPFTGTTVTFVAILTHLFATLPLLRAGSAVDSNTTTSPA